MKTNYIFDSDANQQVIAEHASILERLRSAYQDAQQIFNALRNYDAGDGEWYQEFDSFMQLILMYHRDVASNGDEWQPYLKFIEAFENLNASLESYPNDSSSYKELRDS